MATTITITSPNPLAPIQRLTTDQRLANFTAQSNSIYNRFSPYDGSTGGIGFSQPFVYTKLTDSNISKNLTKYDSQTFPIGSTIRDAQRVGKFLLSGAGVLHTGKQLLLQQQNAFNETRVYNILSPMKATLKPGSLGAIGYPQRHVETSGGLLNFFKDSLLSTIGMATKSSRKPTIDGTAVGEGGTPFSNYAGGNGGARAGLIRYNTATAATARFSQIWAYSPDVSVGGGGLLARLGNSLKNKLSKLIPSTNPMGAFGGNAANTWKYRPEYATNTGGKTSGVYFSFLDPTAGLLNVKSTPSSIFYNDPRTSATDEILVTQFHRYTPSKTEQRDKSNWYAPTEKLKPNPVQIGTKTNQDGVVNPNGEYYTNLESMLTKMVALIGPSEGEMPQGRASIERYSDVTDMNPNPRTYPNYKAIPSTKGGNVKFEAGMAADPDTITLDKRGFSKARNPAGDVELDTHDTYNAMLPFTASRDSTFVPNPLVAVDNDSAQSKDIIFFYFFDLINSVYIPFRATISGLSEQNSADWEDVAYMGRADKLFVYKGFSRDVNLAFTVYANSINELIPMWKRINYLVGLTRPSKYTGKGVDTAQAENGAFLKNTSEASIAAARTSQFIYPPMVTLRLGDLYWDQPCVISSISVNIPDDTNWESYRGDDEYNYVFGPDSIITKLNVKSRQLPLKADISMTLKLMEKSQSLTSATDRYGFENAPL